MKKNNFHKSKFKAKKKRQKIIHPLISRINIYQLVIANQFEFQALFFPLAHLFHSISYKDWQPFDLVLIGNILMAFHGYPTEKKSALQATNQTYPNTIEQLVKICNACPNSKTSILSCSLIKFFANINTDLKIFFLFQNRRYFWGARPCLEERFNLSNVSKGCGE